MRLTELEPYFIRYLDRREWSIFQPLADTPMAKAGIRSYWQERDQQYHVPVETFADMQGFLFLCLKCWRDNSGPIGTHLVQVTAYDRGVLDSQGAHNGPNPTRWAISGTGFEDLTVSARPGSLPSIQLIGGCNWHGMITGGEVYDC